MTRPVHSSPLSCANRTTIRLKIVKLCPRPAHFSLRFPKSDRLPVLLDNFAAAAYTLVKWSGQFEGKLHTPVRQCQAPDGVIRSLRPLAYALCGDRKKILYLAQ